MVEATLSIGRFEMGGDWLIRYTDGKIKYGVAVEPGSNILIVLASLAALGLIFFFESYMNAMRRLIGRTPKSSNSVRLLIKIPCQVNLSLMMGLVPSKKQNRFAHSSAARQFPLHLFRRNPRDISAKIRNIRFQSRANFCKRRNIWSDGVLPPPYAATNAASPSPGRPEYSH